MYQDAHDRGQGLVRPAAPGNLLNRHAGLGPTPARIAVIGSGVTGLGAALTLSRSADQHGCKPLVTLFERDARPGGHVHTIPVSLDGISYPVDTGFLVFNHRTYPNLLRLFADLDVETTATDMSFSVRIDRPGRQALEWSGSNLDTVFAQRRNLANPRFLTMLADILRFNREATALARAVDDPQALTSLRMTLGDYLDLHHYSRAFCDWYLLPMGGAIWSCSTQTMRGFPLATFVRFCDNHGLLQVNDRPPWYTVTGGGRRYVDKILAQLDDVRLATPVHQVQRRSDGRVLVVTPQSSELFDAVVIASHSDQALRMLADPSALETQLLGAIRYQANRALLHTDASLMPSRRKAWAAWNYHRRVDPPGAPASHDAAEPASVSVTYWSNQLQPLPFSTQVFVTLNPVIEPAPQRVIAEIDYAHPIFDQAAIAAQQRLASIQGQGGVWFAGAWCRYGFHEDGLSAGLHAAQDVMMTLGLGSNGLSEGLGDGLAAAHANPALQARASALAA